MPFALTLPDKSRKGTTLILDLILKMQLNWPISNVAFGGMASLNGDAYGLIKLAIVS